MAAPWHPLTPIYMVIFLFVVGVFLMEDTPGGRCGDCGDYEYLEIFPEELEFVNVSSFFDTNTELFRVIGCGNHIRVLRYLNETLGPVPDEV